MIQQDAQEGDTSEGTKNHGTAFQIKFKILLSEILKDFQFNKNH